MRAEIYLWVRMSNGYIIPLNGLTTGKTEYVWKVGKEFFESFENSEILDAELDATVVVEKSGRYVGVDCVVSGSVTVECDRCLGALEMPIDADIMLSVKFGDEESSEEHQEGEREVIFVSDTEAELDLSQIIYDYVCLDLPMQRVHEDGECDPEAVKHLSEGFSIRQEEEDNPFAALKNLF